MRDSVETIELDYGVTVRIEYDTDVRPPHEDMDMVGKIAYLGKSRDVLGSEAVSKERMDEISRGIASGELIGLPVYAYVHGSATVRTVPFHDPWDSGQSGFVYCERERAISECGSVEKALECLKLEVETFDDYLTGNVYGFVVEDAEGKVLDSCWGFYGLDYCKECALEVVRNAVEQAADALQVAGGLQ